MAEKKEPRAQIIAYSRPEKRDVPKTVTLLARSDIVFAAVQNLLEGGENNLHHHRVSGRILFRPIGSGSLLYGGRRGRRRVGRHQGVFLEQRFPSWFESVGDEPLELLQVEASNRAMETPADVEHDRVDHTPTLASFESSRVINTHMDRSESIG